MKIRSSHLLYGIVAVAVAAWALSYLVSGDAGRIRHRLAELGELIEKTGPENNLVAANKARRLGEYFTRAFEIHIEPHGQVVSDRRQLLQVAMGYRSRSERIGVGFHDQELTVDGRRRAAEMELVASLSGRRMSLTPEKYRLRIEWSEEDGEWRIRRLDVLEFLDSP